VPFSLCLARKGGNTYEVDYSSFNSVNDFLTNWQKGYEHFLSGRKRKKGMKMRRLISSTLAFSVLLAGCAAAPKSNVLFQHTPLLPKGTVDVVVGIEQLEDKRPEKEKKLMKSISELSQQVTWVLFRDFRDAELFESISLVYDPQKVDVVVKGEIQSFFWKSDYSATTFVPIINVVHLVGVPCGESKGRVEIYLEFVNPKNGEVFASYTAASDSSKAYSLYESSSYHLSGGQETGDAFRVVAEQLRDRILADKDKILSYKNR